MTAEEFTAEAEKVLSPPIERLVQMAFETVPADRAEILVMTALGLMTQVAVRAVRSIIAESRH